MSRVIPIMVVLFLASAGCQHLPSLGGVRSGDISEIHMKIQTGHSGASADIAIRRDGSVELSCNFYRSIEEGLKEDSVPVTAIDVCRKRFKSSPDSFAKTKNEYGSDYIRGLSKATATSEQLSDLADLIVRNGYFSMYDRYEIPGLMDAPPTITRVVHSGGEKTVSNQGGKGGPKLDEIQKAIYALISLLDWQKV